MENDEDFRILITRDRPSLPGYIVLRSAPLYVKNIHGGYGEAGQSWTLVKEERYALYRELDLHYDFKTIEQAKNYVNTIDLKIEQLKRNKEHLTRLLKDSNVL